MNRKVYLVGEIEKRFGSEFSMYAKSYSDIIQCIDCNRPGFRKYLLDCYEKGIGFSVNFAGKDIEKEDLFIPIKEGDVTITAVPAGSASDALKVVAAIFLIWASGGFSAIAGGNVTWLQGMTSVFEAGSWAAQLTTAIGITLLNQGIQGMLAPDPAVEEEQAEGYLYTGSETIVVEGDPVPVLYGELRVPGQPISMALNSTSYTNVIEKPFNLEADIYSDVITGLSVSTATLEEYDMSEINNDRFGEYGEDT